MLIQKFPMFDSIADCPIGFCPVFQRLLEAANCEHHANHNQHSARKNRRDVRR